MITELPDLKSIDAEENKRQIRNWMGDNSHVPSLFLLPFLMHKTLVNYAEVMIKVKEAKRKGEIFRNLKHTTVILPK